MIWQWSNFSTTVVISTCLQIRSVFFGKKFRWWSSGNIANVCLFFNRQDFMVIPFQAIEVYLDNVLPTDSEWTWDQIDKNENGILDQEEFAQEAIEAVKSTVLGSYFKAMVTGYHYDNTPFIQLTNRYGQVNFSIIHDRWMFLLIQSTIFRLAQWMLIFRNWSSKCLKRFQMCRWPNRLQMFQLCHRIRTRIIDLSDDSTSSYAQLMVIRALFFVLIYSILLFFFVFGLNDRW